MNPVETNRDATGREIVVSRFFDAPRERVWAAWTDPEQIVRWWGPRGFTTTIHEMGVREGGEQTLARLADVVEASAAGDAA